MYFVDQEKIEQTIQLMENTLKVFREQSSWQEPIEKLALERIVHLLIESIVDIGNVMIDGFIMRDPGSYEDIIDILVDEKVVEAEDENPLKSLISFRKSLVQNYIEIDHATILKNMENYLEAIEQFPTKVRRYLKDELGPVSAFKP